jgi:hypothetical protein
MALPLQIRLNDGPTRLVAAAVPYGVAVKRELEFAFIWENEDGSLEPLTPYEFACRDASCRPPTSGGTGGSSKKGTAPAGGSLVAPSGLTHYAPKAGGIGSAEHAKDMTIVAGKGKPGLRTSDGALGESWLDDKGNVVLTAKQEATARKALEDMGTSYEEIKANIKAVALESMNANPEQALRDSKWYKHEYETWGVPLAKKHGVTVEQVMAIAAATSTNKTWDGVKSSNKETVENILNYLKKDEPITITKEQADAYNAFSVDKPSGGGKYGPKTIEPGEYRLSELSSGTLGRIMGSGYGIGGQYFTDGLVKSFAIARGELDPNISIPSLKQRSFTNNLTQPDKDYSITNDFWQVRGLLGDKPLNLINGREPMTVREWEKETGNKPNAFIGSTGGTTGTKSLFALSTKATREALDELKSEDPRFAGMLGHEFQAVTWVQMQRRYAAYEGE